MITYKTSCKAALCRISFALFLLLMILSFLPNTGLSQGNVLIINPDCDLCQDEKGKALLEIIKSENLQPIRADCFTTEPISVYFDIGLVGFGKSKQENLDATLKSIFSDWKRTQCVNKETTTTEDIEAPKETSILDPFTYIPERIAANWSFRTTLTNQTRYLSSLDYYVNPYFQAFGGEPLGIPIAYGAGAGLTVGFGTPYTGPMETDFIRGGLHILLFDIAVTSRIKEFVLKYSSNRTDDNSRNTWIGNWNNLYTPHLGMEIAVEIPVLRVSYFGVIDTSQEYDPPVVVRNEVTGEPMKNNIVRSEYFGFELRTPNLIFYNSTRAKFYFAKHFGEYHLGYTGREMKIDDFIFDFRFDMTFPGKRDFQILTELYLASPWSGFANKAFGFGPSIRLGKTPSNNFGLISAFVNARIKIGDFFDKNLY